MPLVAWDLSHLQKETKRQVNSQMKKTAKAEMRYKKALERGESEFKENDNSPSQLEAFEAAQRKLNLLVEIQSEVHALGSNGTVDLDLEEKLVDLGIKNEYPGPSPRGSVALKKKVKQIKAPTRKPYRIYTAEDGTEIYVGKSAADNDILSLDPQNCIRDQNDWWMHVGGVAGSHVVIRSSVEYNDLSKDTIQDAAALALKFSKGGSRGKVTLTRCRNVSKPRSAPAGMVMLSGEMKSIRVDLKAEKGRLQRLETPKSQES